MITTLERVIESRKWRGLRELTVTEQSEILTTGYYDEEKYEHPSTKGGAR
jgi:hypothetical protein